MAGYVTRDGLLGQFALAEEEYASQVFGGTLVLRELTRAQYRAVRDAARMDEGLDSDLWNVGLFCAGVVDPQTKQPLWTVSEILNLPNRGFLWERSEILRVAQAIMDLSEVGPDALKSGGAAPDH